MLRNPQLIVEWFEEEVANYTGAPYAVACDNCTNAIKICCKYLHVGKVTIPRQTYVSVPQSILQAGGALRFENLEWSGIYQLKPYPIWDAAKRFTSGMYLKGQLMCLSFGIKKNLKLGKGGMILTDSLAAVEALKKLRWSGRQEKVSMQDDIIDDDGFNAYMTPEQAARGLMLLSVYPKHAPDQFENPFYRDLKEFEMFKNVEVI
jgi:dTDP-4-amino-4,6-dideoxygalactose transaminase